MACASLDEGDGSVRLINEEIERVEETEGKATQGIIVPSFCNNSYGPTSHNKIVI